MSEPCPLCGREKMKDRVQRPPPMCSGETDDICCHPSHIYGTEMPPCERLGVERIAKLDERLANATEFRFGDYYINKAATGWNLERASGAFVARFDHLAGAIETAKRLSAPVSPLRSGDAPNEKK